MPGKYNLGLKSESEKTSLMDQGWLKVNLYNLVIGSVVCIILSLLLSVFKGGWMDLKTFVFQLLISILISVCIGNSIYLSYKLMKFNRDRLLLFTTVYYLSTITGTLTGIEIVYFIHSKLFHTEYHFFHFQQAIFSLLIAIVVCTIIFIHNLQKWGMKEKLQQKELDVLRLKQMKTQADLSALQSKINPHFLYNSLNAIASLVHEDPDKAEQMTLQLSKLFRYSINQSQENLVPVKEEMEIVSTYLDIEKVRFAERISFVVEVEETLLQAMIPRFLIQPLVENALKHGLKNMVKDAILHIELKKTNKNKLLITVTDNGIPFPDELEVGYGLQSTYDKLDLLFENQYELQLMNSPVKQIKIYLPLTHG